MKKVTVLYLLLACMLAGCGQKETGQEIMPTQEAIPTSTKKVTKTQETEIIPIIQTVGGGVPSPTLAPGQEAEYSVFRYKESLQTARFDVDEDGLLYTVTREKRNRSYMAQMIRLHDRDGNCIEEHEVKIGNGKAKYLLVGKNYVYVLVSETDCANVLYQIDRTTWEAKRLYDFTEFETVYDMVLLGDTVYVLAEYNNENFKKKEFLNYQEWYDRRDAAKYAVAYLYVEEEIPKLAFVPFDLPRYIFAVNEDELGIYGHEEATTDRLFVYSPEENTFQKTSISHSGAQKSTPRLFQYYEDGIFMVYDWENIYYVSQDGTEHVIVCLDDIFYDRSPSEYFFNKKIVYANGYLFYQKSNYMERIKIEDIMEEILQAE